MKCSVLFEKTFGEGIIFRSVECEFCASFHKTRFSYCDGKVIFFIFDIPICNQTFFFVNGILFRFYVNISFRISRKKCTLTL